jgi:hypothetical protein
LYLLRKIKMRENLEREGEGKGGSSRSSSEKGKGFFHHLDKITTSFFITNFPTDATSEDLWKLFLKYGNVGEVYIPKKLDKRGRRFGFVKFKEVKEVETLSEKLRDVWMGSFKLWVNRSRFGRGEVRETPANKTTMQLSDVKLAGSSNGKSFRDVLLRESSLREKMVLKVTVNEPLCKELQGGVVGLLACEKEMSRIQTTLFMEGFQSIKVTSMGGNMALLRSPVEGDVQRLLRSKNECLSFYFTHLKPWNPGLLAAQREVWIQVYGIPLHVWGDNLFKMVGNKFGSFVDYDMETATMARFDVARLKIITAIWASIDETVKVEVEGVVFNLWVVEERGRHRSVVMDGKGFEDDGSVVVPSEGCNEEAGEDGDEHANSDEDEESGEDMDGDVRPSMQVGVNYEANSDTSLAMQETKEGDISLTCEKSTNIPNLVMEIPSVGLRCVETKETVVAAGDKEMILSVCEKADDEAKTGEGGTKEVQVWENVESDSGGPPPGFEIILDKAGFADPITDPTHLDHPIVERATCDPFELGLFEEGEVLRYSSISEPDEVLSSGRVAYTKNMEKFRKHKSGAKFPKLGVPKCIQFAESVKDVGPRLRRRRRKGRGLQKNVDEAGSDGDLPVEEVSVVGQGSGGEGGSRWQSTMLAARANGVTPPSGINLLSESENSGKSNPILQIQADDREKVTQAAKLLSIQKGVGFTFETNDTETIMQLVDQEKCDRAKKMEWEQREVDQ